MNRRRYDLHRLSRGGPGERAQPVPVALPQPCAGFVGREAELDRLDGLATAAQHAIALVWGTAGVGKTSLALAWARRVADRFPDGQLYADLHGFSPAEAPADAAGTLRVFLDMLGGRPTAYRPARMVRQAGR